MNISAPFISRPVATSLLAAALLVIGIVAYLHLPVAALPVADFPTLQVSASLPGASPETMASNVATPLERQFSLIPGDHPDDLGQLARQRPDHLQFELSRNIDGGGRGRAGGDQRRQRAAADQSAGAADHPQGQPGRRADHDHLAELRHPAARRS